jgi:hypothetical protein
MTPLVMPESPTVMTERLWWAKPLKCLIWVPVSFITGLWYSLQRITTTLVMTERLWPDENRKAKIG